MINKKKSKVDPSLYDLFELGDRVMRKYRDESGKYLEFKGIVLAINNSSIEVFWDTLNGISISKDSFVGFTNCEAKEILKGDKNYSPIVKYRNQNGYI